MGFDQRWVGDEGEQGTDVRESEEAVGYLASLFAEEPDLQERTGGTEQEEGEADGQRQREKDGGDRVEGALAEVGTDELLRGQQGYGDYQHSEVKQPLAAAKRAAGEPVRVEVAEQKGELEEDQAGEPYRRGASERGEELLCRHGLDQKEQEGREEDRKAVERAR